MADGTAPGRAARAGLAVIIGLFCCASAQAQVAEDERWLAGEDVLLGLHEDGSLVNPALDLGLRFDPDGVAGPVPLGADVIVAGYPYEAWSATWSTADGARSVVNGGPHLSSDLPLVWDDLALNSAMSWLHGQASTDSLQIETWITLPVDRPLVWFSFRFTALQDVSELWAARVLDPDLDATTGGYSTDNRTADEWAAAAGLVEPRALALFSEGGVGGLCAWCSTPAGVVEGAGGAGEGDLQIGVARLVGDLAAGEVAELHFVLGLGPDAETALAWAEEAARGEDMDADGAPWSTDCDDRDPTVAPGLEEAWDGLDNDCDGAVDEGTAGQDDDGDGFSEADGDCDDQDPAVYPGAAPGAAADADCDGAADDGDWPPALDQTETEAACGCATPGAGAPLTPLALLLALGARRRRA